MGYSLDEIASLRRVGSGDGTQSVKGLMSKTDTARQGDLNRLLMTMPSPPQSASLKLTSRHLDYAELVDSFHAEVGDTPAL